MGLYVQNLPHALKLMDPGMLIVKLSYILGYKRIIYLDLVYMFHTTLPKLVNSTYRSFYKTVFIKLVLVNNKQGHIIDDNTSRRVCTLA